MPSESGAKRAISRLLVAAYYIAQPVLKPLLRATVGRNDGIWRKLTAMRDHLIAGPTPDAGLGEPLPRRLYASAFFVIGPPCRFLLKQTLGKNQGLWRWMRHTHLRLLRGQAPVSWAPAGRSSRERATIRALPFGVNLAGYLTSEKGTGEAARSAAIMLKTADVPLALNNIIDSGSANREAPPSDLSRENPFAFNVAWVNGDQAANFAFHKGRQYFEGRYNIGAWAWELTDFPQDWIPRFLFFDEIWVPSRFAREALSRVAPIPVTAIPHAIQALEHDDKPVSRSQFGLTEEDFVFLFMFDYHSVFERKNPLGLIKAFRRAFAPQESAALVIKSTHANRQALSIMRDAAAGSRTSIIDAVVPRNEVGALYQSCDCYVSLHRSEGFGLTLAEAMAAGRPVIGTAYGGNLDFMTPENSYLVRHTLVTLKQGYPPYEAGSVWAEPDIAHAAELMRRVYEKRDEARGIGEKARGDIAKMLHPTVVGEVMRERLITIAREYGISVPDSEEMEPQVAPSTQVELSSEDWVPGTTGHASSITPPAS